MSRNCRKCGGQVGDADLYCIHCGTPLERVSEEEQQKPAQMENARQTQHEDAGPEMARPLSVKDYLLVGVLLSIPIVNIVLAILWAAGKNENPNRRNLARAWLIFSAIGAVVSIVFVIGLARAVWLDEQNYPERYEYYDEYYDEYYEDWEDWEDWEDYDYDMEHERHWEDIMEDWGEV